MLHVQVNLPVVNMIHPKGIKFVMGVTIKATCDSKINDTPNMYIYVYHF